MEWIAVVIVGALIFGLCFLFDKGFTKVFRGKVQHTSGLSVRLNKRLGSAGLIVFVLGLAAAFSGGWLMISAGALLMVVGIGLVVYYMTFGVFYDEDSFVYTSFGKRSYTYRYGDICAQRLYNTSGNIVIELHMSDGRDVQLQAGMIGVYPFLDKAFAAWLEQTGRTRESCDFYDPENSCWFPPVED